MRSQTARTCSSVAWDCMTTSMGPRLSECTAGLLKEQIVGWITDIRDQEPGSGVTTG